MSEQYKCADCGVESPPTETNYTLISKEHGWRMTRTVDADGGFSVEWRCPTCWPQYKTRTPTVPPKPGLFESAMNLLGGKRSERPPRR
jgi:DNA-directed RNA polymerase subunit RPC12/RpoP